MKLFDVYPVNDITIEKALGAHLWDDKGTQYLDMYGGHAVISIGHGHPHYISRIEAQLHKIGFYSNSIHIPVQKQLAAKLGEVSRKEDYQLFLVNSGAEANENAMKLASFHTGRSKIIAFSKGFHGRTSLAVAATDNPAIVADVNKTENIIFLPYNDAEELKQFFQQHGQTVAGVIIEAMQGVGGIIEAEENFLSLTRDLCNTYGSLLIADEVQCGYGRTGKFFGTDHAGIDADIYSMAKGMGNGFPVGGILIAPHIHAKHSMLGTTFGGNHLACAAALAVLEVIQQENLIENAASTGDYLIQQLKEVEEIEGVRGRGLMIGFDLPERIKDLRKTLLSEKKIFTGEAKPNVVRLLPALNFSTEQADYFIEALKSSILSITQKQQA
ncbi:MAG: aspartate aminotransferase family protein [Flavisolibacter sp.]|jgi:acetylornithine aminotransferase|nr:aspartate aminotransferase family protein [Flavisolibacter sp.]